MKRPICYQQPFVLIKVADLCRVTLWQGWAGGMLNNSSENALIHAWTAGKYGFSEALLHSHWHCSQCYGLEYHSNSKRSPLGLLRPARACGIEFHRLHIWFIWKIMDFCSYAGLSELLDWTLLCYGQHHWGVWLIHDTFWKGYPCLAQAYRLVVGILCLTAVKMCKKYS